MGAQGLTICQDILDLRITQTSPSMDQIRVSTEPPSETVSQSMKRPLPQLQTWPEMLMARVHDQYGAPSNIDNSYAAPDGEYGAPDSDSEGSGADESGVDVARSTDSDYSAPDTEYGSPDSSNSRSQLDGDYEAPAPNYSSGNGFPFEAVENSTGARYAGAGGGRQCPGGSIEECVAVCPGSTVRVYGACVGGCADRCPETV